MTLANHRPRKRASQLMLRAKVKNFDDMPRGVLCCSAMAQQLTAWKDRTIQIIAGSRKKNCLCLACGAKFTGVAIQGLTGWYVDPRAWEIDEGGRTA